MATPIEDLISKLANDMKLVELDDELIIGLDFGTTFSGIAYAFSSGAAGGNHEVDSIMEWPGLEGHLQPKIDTLISYDGCDGKSFSWSAQAKDKNPLVGMKLLLDPDQVRPMYVSGNNNAKGELRKIGKTPSQIASDYIGALYKHATAKVVTKYPVDYLARCQKKYVITVPAVWSDKAKQATLLAAKAAGIHPVDVITEPEAAALYTLHDMQDRGLKVGDSFVICDAGGGTVDLISYEITKLSPKLELKGLVPSSGSMAGSLVLNNRFENHVRDILDEEIFFALKKKTAWPKALQEFDRNVKTSFMGTDKEEYYINFPMASLPDDEENGLIENCLTVTGKDLKRIFAPVIDDIKKLVKEQVLAVRVKYNEEGHANRNKIKAIFLVGGFGSNGYLKACLQDQHPDIQVIQPNGAWSAIAKGAVLSQMPSEAVVRSTVSSKHYGVSSWRKYDSIEDYGEKTEWCASEGIYKVCSMTWYISIGDDLRRDKAIRVPFYKTLAQNYTPKDLIFHNTLEVSENTYQPRWPREGDTSTYVTLKSDLSGVSKGVFKYKIGSDGRGYYDIYYELTLTPLQGIFKFALEIDGKQMGSVTANYH